MQRAVRASSSVSVPNSTWPSSTTSRPTRASTCSCTTTSRSRCRVSYTYVYYEDNWWNEREKKHNSLFFFLLFLKLQHGRVEPFVSHCLDALVFRDTDAHKPLVQLSDHPTPHQEGHIIQQQQQQPFHSENVTVSALASCMLPHGDTYFFEQHACFNSLVQYKLATDDHDHDDNDTDHQDEDNNVFDESSMSMSVAPRRYAAGKHHFLELHRHGEHLSSVHAKCARKLDELERLMQHMLVQVNDKQREAIERASVAGSPQHDQKQRFMVDYGQQTESRRDADFCVDHELERQLAQLALKQLRMMPLKAKIRALQSFATPGNHFSMKTKTKIHLFDKNNFEKCENEIFKLFGYIFLSSVRW